MSGAKNILEAISRGVVVFDGAMGTTLQRMQLANELSVKDFDGRQGCNEVLSLTRPDVVAAVHRGYLEVGCDVVETNTFGGSRPKLDEYDLGARTLEINERAARIAREEADKAGRVDGRPRWVAGSLGPSGFLPSSSDPDLGRVRPSELVEIFREQTAGLLRGGIDVVIAETAQDLLEIRAQIFGARKAMEEAGRRVPIIAQITLDPSGRMLLGTEPLSAAALLTAAGADVMGLNCSTGPKEMVDPLRALAEGAPLPLSCQPNAGIPENREGTAVYPLQPGELAEYLARFVRDFRLGIVGGCCGTTPAHLKLVVEAVRGSPAPRKAPKRVPMLSSGLKAAALHQEPRPLIIGERVNSQGSKKMKELLLANDLTGILAVAREQVEGGAHALDICVALTERADEQETMTRVVRLLSGQIEAPLCIDSTEPEVIASALEWLPGVGIVNSVHLERGWEKIDKTFPLLKQYGACTVAMTIDEKGMALTRDRKLEVAKRIYERALKDGLQPWQLLFDVLTFTLATGDEQYRRSAVDTIEGIAAVKEHLPGALTVLGVSNVSFGLAKQARPILNSVFLTHCLKAGLDAAIINPRDVLPWNQIPQDARELAEDLVLARRDDALARLITHFENARGGPARAAEEELHFDTPEARLHHLIVDRQQKGLIETIDECLKTRSAVGVINDVLLGAMKEVGDRFGAGELILPFVLQSAEVMKKAVAYLEQFMEKNDSYSRGTVVLATVFGDVHDIGKNLVKTILSNNGYTVHDLGKQVPVDKIVNKAVEVNASAIGLSALLVSTSRQMPLVVQEMDRRGLKLPIMIGGAAINRKYGWRTAYVEGTDRLYEGGVFYCRDAFEGLDTMNALQDANERPKLHEKLKREAHLHRTMVAAGAERAAGQQLAAVTDVAPRSVGEPPRVSPPFWGTRIVPTEDLALRDIFDCLDLIELYKLQWGVRVKSRDTYQKLIADEFAAKRHELQEDCIRNGWLQPKVIYGYFPCSASGNDLKVLDPDSRKELWTFHFPRKIESPRHCLSDYFGAADVVAFQAVTVGDRATKLCAEWEAAGEFTRSYFLHGLAVETAEALAEYWHRRVRAEMGLPDGQGKRYSAGYPAWPDLADQSGVWAI
ncbi:MAG TPA: homocysteine S-methyltransferase family protein, partial [Myxococcales bacterium]|nr:homocysteine S-methyltransferase family protein [Myxococcales bacterium]